MVHYNYSSLKKASVYPFYCRAVGGTSAITGTANGLIPYSPKQIAVAVTTATTATGNPGTVAAGPDLKCFDFESFYYGCTLISVAPGASTAEACTISVSGYRGSAMVGEQAFNFGQPVSFDFACYANAKGANATKE